jgi:hypothetical protein
LTLSAGFLALFAQIVLQAPNLSTWTVASLFGASIGGLLMVLLGSSDTDAASPLLPRLESLSGFVVMTTLVALIIWAIADRSLSYSELGLASLGLLTAIGAVLVLALSFSSQSSAANEP